MTDYLNYLMKRLGQFALVVLIGINLAYVITHATPIDPVEQSISVATSFGDTAPEAIAAMRASLQELYGLRGDALTQYVTFWRRIISGDFGPSLSAFPTPVSTLILRAMPWTIGLLATSGNFGNLGGVLAVAWAQHRGIVPSPEEASRPLSLFPPVEKREPER